MLVPLLASSGSSTAGSHTIGIDTASSAVRARMGGLASLEAETASSAIAQFTQGRRTRGVGG